MSPGRVCFFFVRCVCVGGGCLRYICPVAHKHPHMLAFYALTLVFTTRLEHVAKSPPKAIGLNWMWAHSILCAILSIDCREEEKRGSMKGQWWISSVNSRRLVSWPQPTAPSTGLTRRLNIYTEDTVPSDTTPSYILNHLLGFFLFPGTTKNQSDTPLLTAWLEQRSSRNSVQKNQSLKFDWILISLDPMTRKWMKLRLFQRGRLSVLA